MRAMKSNLRPARVHDVPAIHQLVNFFADRGEMLPRSLSEIYDHLRDYMVIESDGRVAACCALHVTWGDLAEIRSLAVEETCRHRGFGRQLVEACLAEARALGLPRVFVLTYLPDYFAQFGFVQVDKAELPQKVWSECFRCPKFPDCGEVSMILDL